MIEIDGRDLAQMKDKERTSYRAANMGFVFQFYNLLPVLTAVENVEMPLLLDNSKKVKAKEARQLAMEALDSVGLADQADQLPGELSGGQRQRVTIARPLVNRPAIVWADEPTGDLDSKTSQDIVDLMRRLNQENGQTFVVVAHSEEIGRQTDRIIWMRDGQIEHRPELFLPPISLNGNGYHNGSKIVLWHSCKQLAYHPVYLAWPDRPGDRLYGHPLPGSRLKSPSRYSRW